MSKFDTFTECDFALGLQCDHMTIDVKCPQCQESFNMAENLCLKKNSANPVSLNFADAVCPNCGARSFLNIVDLEEALTYEREKLPLLINSENELARAIVIHRLKRVDRPCDHIEIDYSISRH